MPAGVRARISKQAHIDPAFIRNLGKREQGEDRRRRPRWSDDHVWIFEASYQVQQTGFEADPRLDQRLGLMACSLALQMNLERPPKRADDSHLGQFVTRAILRRMESSRSACLCLLRHREFPLKRVLIAPQAQDVHQRDADQGSQNPSGRQEYRNTISCAGDCRTNMYLGSRMVLIMACPSSGSILRLKRLT